MTTNARAAAVALVAAAGLTAPAAHAQSFTWTNTNGTNIWNNALNWNPNTGFPNSLAATALFTPGPASTISFNTNISVGTLDFNRPGSILAVPAGTGSTVGSSLILNDSTIAINEPVSTINATLTLAATQVTGTGDITLTMGSSDINDARLITSNAGPTTLGAGITVSGSGRVDAVTDGTIINNGQIVASTTLNRPLQISGTVTQGSAGMLASASPGLLRTATLTLTGGTIETRGANAAVEITSGSTDSVTYDSTSGGTIRVTSGIADALNPTFLGRFGINSGTILSASGTILNNGVIDINSNLSTINATLRMQPGSVMNGSGEVTLTMASSDTNDAALNSNGGFFTLGQDITVRGAGRITSQVNNDGTIIADDPANPLLLIGTFNQPTTGTMRAEGTGLLQLSLATINDGTLTAIDDAAVTLATSTLNTVDTDTAPDASITFISGTNAVIGGSHQGTLGIASGVVVDASGTVTNNGTILINSNNSVINATLRIVDASELLGNGEVRMVLGSSDLNDAALSSSGGFFTIGQDITVRGSGSIGQQVNNNGTIIADNPNGQILRVSGTVNQGTLASLRAADQGRLSLSSLSLNNSALAADADGTIEISSSTLTGVSISESPSAIGIDFVAGTNTIDACVTSADLNLRSGVVAAVSNTLTLQNGSTFRVNSNTSTINAGLQIASGGSIIGNGRITLEVGSSDLNDATLEANAGPATIGSGVSILGTGRLIGQLTLSGPILPGTDGTPGQLNAAGTIALSPTTSLNIDLAGTPLASHDRITGSAAVTLGGTLKVVLVNAYAPAVGDSFDIITAASITSDFTTLDLPGTASGFTWRTFINPTSYRLVFTCLADLTGDGIIDSGDLADFITAFIASDPDADVTNDGQVDSGDLATFVTLFLAGAC